MKERLIITSGKKYIDIDAYAGIFAYKKLLQSLGYDAYAYNAAPENESVCPMIKDMHFRFDDIAILPTDQFIVLDVSNPDFFSEGVLMENVVEIIDHHTGFEDYWHQKQANSQIEFIGSICTIIYERYTELHKEALLDTNLCKLLIAGILDNTLNLKNSITTERDIKAYQDLKRIGNIEDDFRNEYFESCYQNVDSCLKEMIANDIKIEFVSNLLPEVFGQLIVLDANIVLNQLEIVNSAFDTYSEWMLNVMSLNDGKSYLIFHSDIVKEKLETLFEKKAEDNYLVLDDFLLRKQIMKLAREKEDEIKSFKM